MLAGLTVVSHLSGYRQDRITAFLDPWSDIQGSGWHTAQGLIALGSGGPFGVGLGDSHQKFYWVPNAHTDAIFAIIGEELGFLGALGVLALFAVLTWRGFLHAWRAPDSFGRLFGTGLTCLLGLQALINIAVVTNSVPYTGVTLPLVSFGGSSTVISMLAVGPAAEPVSLPAPRPAGGAGAARTGHVLDARLARWHVERVVSHRRRGPSAAHPKAAARRIDTGARSVRRLYRSRRAFEARDD